MTQTQPSTQQNRLSGFRNPVLLRILLIGFLILLLNIPVSMISGTINERSLTRTQAGAEVAEKWGKTQRLAGPFLTVPYKRRWTETDATGKKTSHEEILEAHFLPETLDVGGNIKNEVRRRGIFDFPVYRAQLRLSGEFRQPDFSSWNIRPEDVLWDRSRLTLLISDTRALQDQTVLEWNGASLGFLPGSGGEAAQSQSGIHAPLGRTLTGKRFAYSMPLAVNGSGGLYFAPFAGKTRMQLQSDWPHPSFSGGWLPKEYSIGDHGFDAAWSISHLGRNYPQTMKDMETYQEQIAASYSGVDFLSPVDSYRASERIVKYAVLFLTLTFLTIWLFEVMARLRVHPVQYLLVGSAMCLFYLLQLSLSEHIGFGSAYLLASAAVTGMVTVYGLTVLKTGRRATLVGGILGGLYGYLYVLLRLQDYALLIGSVGLFLALAVVMYVTRRLDWHNLPGDTNPTT